MPQHAIPARPSLPATMIVVHRGELKGLWVPENAVWTPGNSMSALGVAAFYTLALKVADEPTWAKLLGLVLTDHADRIDL